MIAGQFATTGWGRHSDGVMSELLDGCLYDYPKYYDLLFGSDCAAEMSFLKACFQRYCEGKVTRVFEPACGTGRLMIRLARAGFEVAGNDLNPRAVTYCNDRLERSGFPATAAVGDMTDFRLRRRVDAAFNMINSFRHLDSEPAARSHLQCVAASLTPGGIYLLGLHLTPIRGPRDMGESWSARRGHLAINSNLHSIRLDRRRRIEDFALTFDIYTPTSYRRIVETMRYRTYSVSQILRLLESVPELEWIESFDFGYDITQPATIDASTEDVVLVLRRR